MLKLLCEFVSVNEAQHISDQAYNWVLMKLTHLNPVQYWFIKTEFIHKRVA
jgi:hypothetical protein